MENVAQSDKSAHITITGATGMLGCYLTSHLLREGYTDVTVVARSEESLSKLHFFLRKRGFDTSAVRVAYVSLFDIKALEELFVGSDAVFNCAAVVSLDDDKTQRIIEDNVRMAYNVSEAAFKAGVGRLLHVSSIATLTPRIYPEMTDEESYMLTLRDKMPYSIGKFFAENEIWRMAQKGLKTVIVNPAVIIGEGDWKGYGTPAMFRIISRVSSFYTDGITGYVSACDAARFMERLAFTEEAVGKRFILCSDNLSYKELITYIAEAIGKRPPHIRLGGGMVKLLEKVNAALRKLGVKGTLPSQIFRNLTEKAAYDGTYAERVAGMEYSSVEEEINTIGKAYLKETENKTL